MKTNVPMRLPISHPAMVSRKATETGNPKANKVRSIMRLSRQRRLRMSWIERQPARASLGAAMASDRKNPVASPSASSRSASKVVSRM
jgi:hypothetical protein